MAIKKKYKSGGTTSKKMGGKKYQMAGARTQNVPAASFLEQPTAQPFAGDPSVQGNPNEFVAKTGGVKKRLGGRSQQMKDLRQKQRETRKKEREERRADRKADREAVRALKGTSKLKRRLGKNQQKINEATGERRNRLIDKRNKLKKKATFEDDTSTMSRADRRADRKATNKASRAFKRQERKARRTSKKELRQGQRGARQEQRGQDKIGRQEAIAEKLNVLNQSESSSVKTPPVVKKKEETVVTNETDNVAVKKNTPNPKSVDNMSFSEAYRNQRDANKKAGVDYYGDDSGYFTWRGKEYNTESKEEKVKRLGNKKDKNKDKTTANPNEIKGKNKGTVGGNVNIDEQGNIITPKKNQKKVVGMSRKGGYRRRGGKR